MMYYTFIVETRKKICGSTSHFIAKPAESSNKAMMQVVSEATEDKVIIENITYVTKSDVKPIGCNDRLTSVHF